MDLKLLFFPHSLSYPVADDSLIHRYHVGLFPIMPFHSVNIFSHLYLNEVGTARQAPDWDFSDCPLKIN